MDVLITGADTDLGREVAEAFRNAGHRLVVSGARRDEVETLARDLDSAGVIVCDPADPAGLAAAQPLLPHQLDAVIAVPDVGSWATDPRTFGLTDTAAAWTSAFARTVLAAVLTAQAVGDQLRSGGSIVAVAPHVATNSAGGPESPVTAALNAALSAWTAGQADHFGTRGITVNTVACGRAAQPGYEGLISPEPTADNAIARLALFLTTPAARHITGQTLHVGRPGRTVGT